MPGGKAPEPPLRSIDNRIPDHGSVVVQGKVNAKNLEVGSEGQAENKSEPTLSIKEDWSKIQGLGKSLDAKITIGSEEQNEKARKWFDKNAITISCSYEKYDPFRYEDDFNRLVKSAHPTTTQVASMMICLAPIRKTRPGVRLFGMLDKTMKKAERFAAKERRDMKKKGIL